MPEPTNPKKRSLMAAGRLRKALRAAGHRLNAIVQVGKEGATAAVLAQLSEALDHHELVKVKVGTESPEDRFEVAERIQAEGNAQVAQVIGRVILAYRKHARTPKFEPLSAPLPDDDRDDAPVPSKRRPGATGARASTRTRKPAPGREQGVREPKRWSPRAAPVGDRSERRPHWGAPTGDRRRPPPGKPRSPRKESAGDRRRPPPGKPRGPRKAPAGGRPGGRPPRGR